jgi:hypothetical protein
MAAAAAGTGGAAAPGPTAAGTFIVDDTDQPAQLEALPAATLDPLLQIHLTGTHVADAPRRPMTDVGESGVARRTRFKSTEETILHLRVAAEQLSRDDWMYTEVADLLPLTGNL